MSKEKIIEKKGIYYSDCEFKGDKDKFTLKCKSGKPAVKIQVEKSED